MKHKVEIEECLRAIRRKILLTEDAFYAIEKHIGLFQIKIDSIQELLQDIMQLMEDE